MSSPIDAEFSLGAEPVVLRDGTRALPWRDPNVINPRQPHTLVGWNKAGEVFLVAIDGRQPASEGMTMAEAADFLLALGATDAVNLDGGGGTTFVAGGSVWNRPSDNDPAHPAQYSERGTANAFVVMPRPGAPLPAATPPPPGRSPAPPARRPPPGRAGPPTGLRRFCPGTTVLRMPGVADPSMGSATAASTSPAVNSPSVRDPMPGPRWVPASPGSRNPECRRRRTDLRVVPARCRRPARTPRPEAGVGPVTRRHRRGPAKRRRPRASPVAGRPSPSGAEQSPPRRRSAWWPSTSGADAGAA